LAHAYHDQYLGFDNPRIIEVRSDPENASTLLSLDLDHYAENQERVRYTDSGRYGEDFTLTAAVGLTENRVEFLSKKGRVIQVTSRSSFELHFERLVSLIQAQLQTAVSA